MSLDNRSSFPAMLRVLQEETLKQVRVSLPGQVLNFDTSTQLAEVQIGLRRRTNGNNITPAPVINVPVHFPGGDFLIEYEISAGTEGIVLFAHRDITSWLDSGQVQNLSSLKKLDINDCFFIPGLRSQPSAISDFQNNGIRMRNQSGTSHIWLKNDGSIDIVGTEVNINGVRHDTHVHEYTDDGTPLDTQGPKDP